ncbi:MAG: hypothetical protein ACREC0_10840 [Methylocella sp.]
MIYFNHNDGNLLIARELIGMYHFDIFKSRSKSHGKSTSKTRHPRPGSDVHGLVRRSPGLGQRELARGQRPCPNALHGLGRRCDAATSAACDTAEAASTGRPDDMNADDIAGELCKAETRALDELVVTPCMSDADFIEKLKVQINREVKLFGLPFGSNPKFVSIARAVALHFGAGAGT